MFPMYRGAGRVEWTSGSTAGTLTEEGTSSEAEEARWKRVEEEKEGRICIAGGSVVSGCRDSRCRG